MAKTMGAYCKAYPLKRLREYPGWSENVENVREETNIVDGKEVKEKRQLTDDSPLYLQENYVVTDGIFMDEHVIFDDVTPEWIEFCTETLGFSVPEYESTDA